MMYLSKHIKPAVVLVSGLFVSSTAIYAAEDKVKTAPLHQHSSVKQPQPEALKTTSNDQSTQQASLPEQAPALDENKVVIVNRPLIAGLWEMRIPNAKCNEFYNFMENGEFVVKSGEEWTYGNYVYQLPALADTGHPILAMKIKYDNLKTDCSGNSIDQRGEEQQQYVVWTGQSTARFCATEDGKQCFAEVRRITP